MVKIFYNYRNRLCTGAQIKTVQTRNGTSALALYPPYTVTELLGMGLRLAEVARELDMGECHLVLYPGSERRFGLVSEGGVSCVL